ncbi:MAG: choice-of-anchor Q domain-containing protein, partial [Anaerolineaceae bacterium]
MFKYRFTHSLTRIPQSLMIILCIIGITIAGFLPTQMVSAEGNTLYVSSSGTDDGSCGGESSPCATIAQAVTNSTAGDIIIVGEGIFFPPTATSISIDKNLTIRGQGAANTMVYRTGSERRIFDISGSSVSVTLEDLTIWNGAATGDSGGGIKVFGGASLSLDSVTVKDNHAASGAGVYLEGGGNLSVNNSTFTGNVATGNGGAIYMSGAGTMTVTSSIFGGSSDTKNQAVNGAAIYQVDSDGSISGGTFSYNAASGSGGAVYLTGSSASLAISDSAEFKSNTVSSNGAAFYLASGALETSGGVVISSNTATVNGGGIYQAGGTVSLTDTTLSSNGAVLGAGIYQQAGTLDILRSTLNANTASTSGAGLYLASASGANSLSNTTLSGNTANGTGTTDGGGAIYKTGASTLSFDSVTIAYNTAARNANSGVRVASTSGTVTALNSLFYFNGSGTTHANCSGTVYASGDTNLDSGATCGFSSERSNKDPQLGALADNGGYTYTHALPYLSGENPAIDSGSTDMLTDQRGKTRPDGSSPDVGAFEFQRPAISLNTTGALSYTELDAATQIAPAATYSDDVSSFTSGDVLTVTLTDAQTGDVLGIKTTSKIQVIQSSGSYYVLYDGSTNIGAVTGAKYQTTPDSSPLMISFNSNASRLAIEYLIKAITFENTQINPSETPRSVSFVIEHGGVDSESVSRDISVSNPNLPPLAKNVSITIDENEIYTDTNFAGSDHYNDPDQHSLYGIIVIQMPAHGSLTVNGASVIVDTIMPVGSGDVVYTPDSDYFGYDSFQWKAVDNGDESNPGSDRKTSTSSATYSITIIAVNDAPTTNGQTTKALAAISEDATAPAGETVANLITSAPSAYYDADDDGLAGIAVVANAATSAQGVWQFSTDSGSTWTDLPGGIGSEIDDTNALVLESAGMLRFLPAANWNGAPGSLILRVWDGTAGQLSGPAGTLRDISDLVGGSGAYSSEIVALTTQVSAVNDDPTEVLLSSTEIDENLPIGTVVAIISANDVDLITNPGTETMVYTLGGVDAAKFSISGDELLTAEMFDYETMASYAIAIQAEDSASSTVVTPFTITVVDDVLTVSVANTTVGPGTANEKDTPEDGQFTLSLEKSYPYALTVNYTTTTSTA